jgi:hypothetical protein
MATRVEKQTVSGTDVVVGYGVVNIASYSAPVPPATQGTTTYTTQDAVVDVEIDYTAYLSRIATALETIATQTTTVATKLTEIEEHQQRIRELGEGDGIHMIGPYEQFGFVSIYRSLIEEGKILAWRDAEPSEKDVAKALNDLGKYIEKIRTNIPRSF